MSGIEVLTLTQLAKHIEDKDISPVEVTERMLDRIASCNHQMNAFVSVLPEDALQQALAAESDILKGNYKGPLHGIPISIKDNIAVKGMRLTNGSFLYYNHISDKNAPIVEQIKRHGSIVIGKTNLDEFANNVTGVNKVYGTIQNAINPLYTAGGSSGGSAVSVANQLAYGSLGTDTSGSIRIPAACNGIVGLKPTTNLLPTTDIYPLSWTMDHVGLLSRDCDDLYHLYHGVTEKQYRRDMPQLSMNKLKVGIVDEKYLLPIHPEVKKAYDEVIKELVMNEIALEYIEMPRLEDMLEVLEIVIGFEAAYIHQYNFMYHKDTYDELNIEYLQESSHISNEAYEQALSQVKKIGYRMQRTFEQVDFVIIPTLPMTVPMGSEKNIIWGNGLEGILEAMSRYTGLFNVSGLPALNITMGRDGNAMPIGLQAIGGYYQEKKLISFGKLMYEILDKKE